MKYLFTGFILSLALGGFAQDTYWQQQADNHIEVTLDDTHHMLRGHIRIDYYNHSPDTLTFIYFHLYPNAYRNDRTAYERQAVENGRTAHYFSEEKDRGSMDSLRFTVQRENGELSAAGVVATRDDDIVKVILPQPLAPGAHITIETPFRVKIPKVFSRLGHTGQSYEISQWFPKPAVYDRKGWHPIPYLDQGEFYSEFGSWHVAVTLPQNYIVMGTGNIQEASENAWLDSLAALPLPQKPLTLKGMLQNRDTATIASSAVMKTVTFEENNVHDFAWFASKKWVVRKDTVAVPGTGQVVTAYSCFYPAHAINWSGSISDIKTAIRGYSSAVGPYPFKTVKAVEGSLVAGGGMEYPTITVIAPAFDKKTVKVAVVHEVGHNWFYGMLGSNERSYPWMDEGINSFYEHKFVGDAAVFKKNGRDENFLVYAVKSATHDLVPADTAAPVMPEINYGVDIYGKSSYLVAWLEDYIGKDTFESAMKDYFSRWQYKHPQPEDFRRVMQEHSSKNLDWFFDEAMTTTKPVDFSIVSVQQGSGQQGRISIRNVTGNRTPVKYTLYGRNAGGDSVSVSGWTPPFTGRQSFEIPSAAGEVRWRSATIDPVIPDYNAPNNNWHTPLALKLFAGLNLDTKRKIWLSPAIGYNYYDGFMAGALIHNITLPQNKFQFALAPLYAFGSGAFAGTGFMSYIKNYDEGWLHDIQFQVSGKTFSFDKVSSGVDQQLFNRYIKIAPEMIFTFRKPEWRSPVERTLSLKAYWIREGQFNFTQAPGDSIYYPSKGAATDHFYGKVTYLHKNSRTFNPFSYQFEGQIGKEFAKLSAEANLRVDYFQKNKALYIRAYAGKFFTLSSSEYDAYRYRIANTYSGPNDYLYDETYAGRSEQNGFWSQQISMKEGGFKVNTLQYASQLGLSNNWLLALNLKTDIPYLKLPVRVFADLGTFSDARQNNPSGASVLFDAGLEVYISDYLNVYIPLFLCKDFKDYANAVYTSNKFLKTISFSINLGNLNWSKLPAKILAK